MIGVKMGFSRLPVVGLAGIDDRLAESLGETGLPLGPIIVVMRKIGYDESCTTEQNAHSIVNESRNLVLHH